jgi:hypothetical protein
VTKEPNGLWDLKDGLIEEGYHEVIKKKGIKSGHQDFEVLTGALKFQLRVERMNRVSGDTGRFLPCG